MKFRCLSIKRLLIFGMVKLVFTLLFLLILSSVKKTNEAKELNLYELFGITPASDDVKQTKNTDTPTKILIFTYPRSGSSLLGEIMSVTSKTSYFFEPVAAIFDTDIEKIFPIHQNETIRHWIRTLVEDVFKCEQQVLQFIRSTEVNRYIGILRKNTELEDCQSSNKIVVKEIRLHLEDLEPWIYQSDIKLVHLYRDPRATFNSMKVIPRLWKNILPNVTARCSKLYKDLDVKTKMPKHQYTRLRYEDLMESPLATLKNVFSDLNLKFDKRFSNSFFNHLKVVQQSGREIVGAKVEGDDYFSVFKGKTFKHDHWRSELSHEEIIEIEKSCQLLMNDLKYETIH